MDKLSQEVAAVRGTGAIPKVPAPNFPGITLDLDTPSKKRKFEDNVQQNPSYANATLAGVQPLTLEKQQNSMRMLQQVFQQQTRPKPVKSPRNICYGNSRTSGQDNVETMLAADVDLVASGVSKDCSNDDLSEFLKGKKIDVVAVETLTKDEVLDQVRTKTFKITVKAAQYEAALQPEVWPYRVAVRHYRAPRRQAEASGWSDQSGKSGGRIDRSDQQERQRQPQHSSRNLPVGHPQHRHGRQQTMEKILPDPIQISNLFDLLGKLGSQEVSYH